MDSELLEMMSTSVAVYTHTDRDSYGVASYSTTPTVYKARVIETPGAMRSNGDVQDMQTIAWIASTSYIRPNAKIVLPNGTAPPIAQIQHFTNEVGIDHVKILFGWDSP